MKAHPDAGCLRINWLIFGSNHHEERPEGGVLENFTMCAAKEFDPNHHTKLIGDPAKLLMIIIHNALCHRKYYELDENGKIVEGPLTKEVHFEKVRINHYFCKSREEFILKRSRGMADQFGVRDMSIFDGHDQNVYTDTEILSRR